MHNTSKDVICAVLKRYTFKCYERVAQVINQRCNYWQICNRCQFLREKCDKQMSPTKPTNRCRVPIIHTTVAAAIILSISSIVSLNTVDNPFIPISLNYIIVDYVLVMYLFHYLSWMPWIGKIITQSNIHKNVCLHKIYNIPILIFKTFQF